MKRTCKCGVVYTTGPLPGGGYQPYKCNCPPAKPPKGDQPNKGARAIPVELATWP